MGMAHYGLGEFAEAVPYLKDATAGDAQNLPLRLVLAHSCPWSKQYQCVLNIDREILILNAELAETAQERLRRTFLQSIGASRSGHRYPWNPHQVPRYLVGLRDAAASDLEKLRI
jgi:hypothetical protein